MEYHPEMRFDFFGHFQKSVMCVLIITVRLTQQAIEILPKDNGSVMARIKELKTLVGRG
jgi:hypothetical protein